MPQFISMTSSMIPLPFENVDTDQIIPARFLRTTDKHGLGDALFADWRYNVDGTPNTDFVMNEPKYQNAKILLAGNNFGCGSSREHATWALTGFGFRSVISTSFADIFRNNALKNGLLPIVVGHDTHKLLFDLVEEVYSTEITIDLEKQSVLLPDGQSFTFAIDPFSKNCLLKGVDQLGYILKFNERIVAYEQREKLTIIP